MTRLLTKFRPYEPRRTARLRTSVAEPRLSPTEPLTSTTDGFTIGLEEEMFVTDARTFDCVHEMPAAFMDEATIVLGARVKREVISSMIELVTGTHASLSEAGEELRLSRAALALIAQRHGLALLACGTHPFSDWRKQTLTPKARYEAVHGSLGALSTRIHVCGLHIHVAVPDPGQRISVMNRAQRFLPVFLALSTSSPFWRGASTGLKSYRSAANDETPRTGLPIRFADTHEFDRYVAKLENAGFIPDQTFLWWAIRPSLKYPTLELRISDCCTDWRDGIGIAALYRSLVHALVGDPSIGAEWEDHHYLVNNENRWQAIRHGLDGHILDSTRGTTEPLREHIANLVTWLKPHAEALGCGGELDHVARILQRGTSAELQTRTFDAAVARGAGFDEAMRQVAADIACRTLAA